MADFWGGVDAEFDKEHLSFLQNEALCARGSGAFVVLLSLSHTDPCGAGAPQVKTKVLPCFMRRFSKVASEISGSGRARKSR